MHHIKAIRPSEDEDLAEGLLAIQRAAYRVEASLIGDDRIPALHEDVTDLRTAPLNWLGAYTSDRLTGAVAWTENADEVAIDRLIVHPAIHRRGFGSDGGSQSMEDESCGSTQEVPRRGA